MPIVRRLLVAMCVLVVVAAAGRARAQPAAPPSLPERQGLLIGFGLHAGNLSCTSEGDECDGVTEAGGLDFHIGAMVRPRLAVVGEIWPMAHTEDGVTITHVITTVGAQYWVARGLWLRGGIGGAHARFTYDRFVVLSDETETVFAVMAAAGYEILASRRFALDLQLRAGTGFYQDRNINATNAGVAVGFTWY
jgi:hypothetical protein